MKAIQIDRFRIGPGRPCFVVAEAGVNHNGDPATARALMEAAAEAGADAVKFQTFRADRLASPRAPKADYQTETTDPAESQLEMLRRLELPEEAFGELAAFCREKGILFLSTPFDRESADLLERLGVSAFKTASGDITDLPFLAHVAGKGRPMIVSTGMSTLDEVGAAVGAVRDAGNDRIVLLHCVSSYPADPAEVNLRAMRTMAEAFDLPVGYSDHTMGIEVGLAAAALGACLIEKHFTLDREMPGPDHRASIEPAELARMVRSIRIVESCLGDAEKRPRSSEEAGLRVGRKSLLAARDLAAGEPLGREDVAVKRPGTGIRPAHLEDALGRKLLRDVPRDEPLTWDCLEGDPPPTRKA